MICKPCAIAADLNAWVTDEGNYNQRQKYKSVARSLHTQCREGTHCDCQHKERKAKE